MKFEIKVLISEVFLSKYDWYRLYFKDESKYMDEKKELLD